MGWGVSCQVREGKRVGGVSCQVREGNRVGWGVSGRARRQVLLCCDLALLAPFQDPEVSAAFQDVATNPANISKYQNNPRVQQVINKLAAKFGTGATGAGEGPEIFTSSPGFS